MLAGVQTLIELDSVEPDVDRVIFQVLHFQRRGVVEKDVMVFPELVLVVRTLRGLGGNFGGGERMRKIAPDKMKLVAVLRTKLIEDTGPVPRAARRSTKIPILDDGNRCIRRPERRVVVQSGF